MVRTLPLLFALLAATPAAALSVSSAACNGHAAELVTTAEGTTLQVDGETVALEEGGDWSQLLCVSRDGETLFGLIRRSGEVDESYFLLDPATGELAPIDLEQARALDFFEDEDDWELGLLDEG